MTENINRGHILIQIFGLEKLYENVAHIDVFTHLFGCHKSFFSTKIQKNYISSNHDLFGQALKHQNKLNPELSSSAITKPPYVEAWKNTGFVHLCIFFT